MPSKTEQTTGSLNFEDALSRLEALIEALEDGDIPLSDLVTKYEEGANLLKVCQSELRAAEKKIEILNGNSGELSEFTIADDSET